MKRIFCLLILLLTYNTFSQKIIDSIYSQKLNTIRTISISLPKKYDPKANKTYPVLYLMDGDYMHDAFAGVLKIGNYWDDLPDLIIVGLYQNYDNTREDDCVIDEKLGLPKDNGQKFFEFFGGELVPYIDSKYKTAGFRIIAGHDTTATFSNYYLYKDNPLFNAYINFSPEFNEPMLENLPELAKAVKTKTFFYMSSADGDIEEVNDSIKKMDTKLLEANNPNFIYKYDEIIGANHYSVVPLTIPKALYHIFSSYQPISTKEYKEKIVVLPSGHVNYLKERYALAESALGYKYKGRYNDFRAIEAAIIKNKSYTEFEELAKMAKEAFPKAMLYEYLMGRFYEYQADAVKAAKSFNNAFLREPIGDLNRDMMLDLATNMKSKASENKAKEKAKEKEKTNEEKTNEEKPSEEKPNEIKPNEENGNEKK